MPSSQWQTESLTRTFLDGVRGAIPCAQTQIDVLLHVLGQWQPAPRTVIDLGCGDGILGRAVLERWPDARVWFVDFSTPMLDIAREKVGDDARATFVQVDFAAPGWRASLGEIGAVDAVISGFAIHHQPDERKRALYGEIYDLLAPGGVFLNLEHVASATPAAERLFAEYFIDHLHAYHSRAGGDKTREEIGREYYARPDKVENLLAPVATQCEWLRQTGYGDVDCFFKVFELALFGGRKVAV